MRPRILVAGASLALMLGVAVGVVAVGNGPAASAPGSSAPPALVPQATLRAPSSAPGSPGVAQSSPSPAAPQAAAASQPPSSTSVPPAAPAGGRLTRVVPVLMYHSIADPPPGARYPDLYVSPTVFRAQMQALSAAGWHTITAGQLGAAMAAGRLVPMRTLVITFDDGYRDNYTAAFPILQQFGFHATFSVVASGIGPMMTAPQLAEMAAAGMEIGNHTFNHVNVARLSGMALSHQIAGAASVIEAKVAAAGTPVVLRTFVYPAGHVGPAAIALLARLGYTDAFTEVPGFAVIGSTRPLQIPRVRVSRSMSAARLLAQLSVPQR